MAKKSSISVLPDLPECVDTAVCNITNPITCNVGNTLGDLWYLVFGGIHQAAEKKRLKIAANLEQFKDELEAGVNAIPEKRKVLHRRACAPCHVCKADFQIHGFLIHPKSASVLY